MRRYGAKHISPELSRHAIDCILWQQKKPANVDKRLTSRQQEVLQLLAEGRVMKEIGSILQMTTRTVSYHKYRIMEVIGVRNGADLMKYAVCKAYIMSSRASSSSMLSPAKDVEVCDQLEGCTLPGFGARAQFFGSSFLDSL